MFVKFLITFSVVVSVLSCSQDPKPVVTSTMVKIAPESLKLELRNISFYTKSKKYTSGISYEEMIRFSTKIINNSDYTICVSKWHWGSFNEPLYEFTEEGYDELEVAADYFINHPKLITTTPKDLTEAQNDYNIIPAGQTWEADFDQLITGSFPESNGKFNAQKIVGSMQLKVPYQPCWLEKNIFPSYQQWDNKMYPETDGWLQIESNKWVNPKGL